MHSGLSSHDGPLFFVPYREIMKVLTALEGEIFLFCNEC